MRTLTERLEIRLPADSLRLLRREANRRGVSVGELVRQAIDMVLEDDREGRLSAAHDLFEVAAPVADWGEMKHEIEEAYSQASSG